MAKLLIFYRSGPCMTSYRHEISGQTPLVEIRKKLVFFLCNSLGSKVISQKHMKIHFPKNFQWVFHPFPELGLKKFQRYRNQHIGIQKTDKGYNDQAFKSEPHQQEAELCVRVLFQQSSLAMLFLEGRLLTCFCGTPSLYIYASSDCSGQTIYTQVCVPFTLED